MRPATLRLLFVLALFPTVAACAPGDDAFPVGSAAAGPTDPDLPLGDVSNDDLKADGVWGAALTCKPVPALPPLVHPEITVSLDGLTVHLVDRAAGFDKVFAAGVGAIDTDATSATFDESKSYAPLLAHPTGDFEITPASIQPCKIWWTDPDTGQRLPVFAGLPFLSWSGAYALHGPIDGYRAANGGSLRRGFVSHGCVRMRAEDVLELYARVKGVAHVPVHVQREPERTAAGPRVDVALADRWIGSECASDADCPFAGGFCRTNAWAERGFCSARCTRSCADRAGNPTTFCVADSSAEATGQGMCVAKADAVDFACRPYDHMVARTLARNGQPSVTASVCMPGSPGWVGDHCFADADCANGTTCRGAGDAEHPGICTMPCAHACADEPGWPTTFCGTDGSTGAGECLRRCTPSTNASECPADSDCTPMARHGDPATVRSVCVPR